MDCEKCKTGTMVRSSVFRLSGCLVGMGFTLLIPSAGILVFTSAMALGATIAAGIEPALGDAGIVAFFGGVVLVVIYCVFLPTLIIGCLLILRKKVWMCDRCGYIFDRA